MAINITDKSKAFQTICQVLTSTYLFYYDFKNIIINPASNIVSPYLIELSHSDGDNKTYSNCGNETQNDDTIID